MHPVLENFNQSGQNNLSAFNQVFKGDLLLQCMHVVYRDREMLIKLVCKELDGGVGTESASFRPPEGALTGALISQPASRRLSNTPAAAAKRHQRERSSMLSAMAASSATITESSRRRLPTSMVSNLAPALASAKAAGCSDIIIDALKNQILKCINERSAETATAKRARLAADVGARSGPADNGGPGSDVSALGGPERASQPEDEGVNGD